MSFKFNSLLLSCLTLACSSEIEVKERLPHTAYDISAPSATPAKIVFKEFSTNDGLPENTALSFLTDGQGYLWVNTQMGLAKFQNNGFVPYVHVVQNKNSIFDRAPARLYLDNNQQLVGVSTDGIVRYDPIRDVFERRVNPGVKAHGPWQEVFEINEQWLVHAPREDSMLHRYKDGVRIDSLLLGKQVDKRFYHLKTGLYTQMASQEGFTLSKIAMPHHQGLHLKTIYEDAAKMAVFQPDAQSLWLGTSQGLLEVNDTMQMVLAFDRQSDLVESHLITNADTSVFYYIMNFSDQSMAVYSFTKGFKKRKKLFTTKGHHHLRSTVGPRGELAILMRNFKSTTYDKLGIYTPSDGRIQFPQCKPYYLLASANKYRLGVISMTYDRQGNLWMGRMNEGVFVYYPDGQEHYTESLRILSKKSSAINYPIHTAGDTVWVLNGHGYILQIQGDNRRILLDLTKLGVNVADTRGIKKNGHVVAVALGPQGVLLYDVVKNSCELVNVNERHDKPWEFDTFTAMLDKTGRLWGTSFQGMYCLTKTQPSQNFNAASAHYFHNEISDRPMIIDNRLNDIVEVNGEILVSGQGYGLYKYRESDSALIELKLHIGGKNFGQQNQRLWLSSLRHGLLQLDTNNCSLLEEHSRITERLSINWVQQSIFLPNNYVVYRGESDNWSLYNTATQRDQILSAYQETMWYLYSMPGLAMHDSMALLPGSDKLFVYNLYHQVSLNRSDLVFTDVWVNGEWLNPQLTQAFEKIASISLPHHQNNLEIAIADLAPQNVSKTSYEYKLIGIDSDWRKANEDMKLTYPALPSGVYALQVRIKERYGTKGSEPVALWITIRTPWWLSFWAFGSYAFCLLTLIYVYLRWRTAQFRRKELILSRKISEATHEITKQKDEIEAQRNRSDELLLNILPSEIAEELKQTGESKARAFDNVTVLFSDFIGFTETSAMLSPTDLVKELNACFMAFDEITTEHHLEKIKTIGDAYMAATGLNEPSTVDVRNAVFTGLQMQAFMEARKLAQIEKNMPYFEMRVGIHTGPVVAGIVGVKKFQYDIWGDTVNTASRMESSGAVGKVNISQATYALLKDDPELQFESRGKIEVKGKGEVEQWFVQLKTNQP